MSANFFAVGNRVINLDLVCAAQREGKNGKVTVFFAAPTAGGAGGGPCMHWTFSEPLEANAVWIKLAPRGGDLSETVGGPYAITDNEQTASREPEPDLAPVPETGARQVNEEA